jgi:hypothetical protein
MNCNSTSIAAGRPDQHETTAPRATSSAKRRRRARLARIRRASRSRAAGVIAASLAASSACNLNQSGDLRASHIGDLANALTARIDGQLAVDQACALSHEGEDAPLAVPSATSPFRRRPYLQQMTAGSVNVDWISGSELAASVVFTLPDGTGATTVTAVADEQTPASETTRAWSAALKDLQPDTTYCYEVRAGDAVWKRSGFRTAPAAGAGRPVRFVAWGDSGAGTEDQLAAYEQMRTVPFDFLVHTGDVGYGSGTTNELQRNYFDVYANSLESFPSFPSSGNHEYNSADATPFRQAFDLPQNGGPSGVERWYSFDWGDAHFIALDTERMGDVQAAWLDADLAANKLPWKIVYGHKPPYSSGEHGSDGTFQKYFNPILEKHHVQLVLNGHDHDYERTTPINGVTYVVTGGGGAGTRDMKSSWFTAYGDAVIHVVYVTIEGNRLTLHALDGEGTEFDSAVIAL